MKYIEFGEYLKGLRLRKGLTMEQAAEALGYDNMGALNAFQRGQATPPVEKLFDIARVYGEPIENILQELEKADPKKVKSFKQLQRRFKSFFLERLQAADASEALQYRPGALPVQSDLLQDRISRKRVNFLYIIRRWLLKYWDLPHNLLAFIQQNLFAHLA